MKRLLESLLPRPLYRALAAPYHFALAFLSALLAGFPARRLTVIGVTGTKGKSSVTEMIAAILEEAGYHTAVSSTIRFKTGAESRPNLYKMTLPGRGFLQQFFREALRNGSTHAVVELTSESALQFRHRFSSLDILVFTNLEKEHLESHGGMEKYFEAKYEIGRELVRSRKRPRTIVANAESEYGKRFLTLPVEMQVPFSLANADAQELDDRSVAFTYGSTRFSLPHPGEFSVRNALAAVKACEALGVPASTAAVALAKLDRIPGRAERIEEGQNFSVIVDYAHTPDSLQALYDAYKTPRKICVLGNTGGGRDTWKRPEMGRIADEACAKVILTDEDPYDEDPRAILDAMAAGMARPPHVILDRREAIRTAFELAREGDAVLITGKGTDPFIMGPRGTKTSWSDAAVAREELSRMRS